MTARGLELEIIDNASRLQAVEAEWRCFLDRVHPPTSFQTLEWLLPWWRHFGSGRLQVFFVRHGELLVGVVPCFLHEWNERRQLTLIGTGISDYLDPVIDPRFSGDIVAPIRQHLAQSTDWDVCDWQDLSADTPFQALGPTAEDTVCTELPLDPHFDDYLAHRPRYLRRNLRDCAKRAEHLGGIEFSVSTHADEELLTTLIDLHGARWQARGEEGMIAANHSAAFLRDAACAFAARDRLRIFGLRAGGRIAALILAFCDESTLFGYLTAFDPELGDYGFGSEALARSLRYGVENGYRSWNFLRGAEPYKFAWGAREIPKRRLTITRESVTGTS
jgi:CelD/BcsL family acetyltransferase involved in cellulose biosynthesis